VVQTYWLGKTPGFPSRSRHLLTIELNSVPQAAPESGVAEGGPDSRCKTSNALGEKCCKVWGAPIHMEQPS
jgi:hypothetical protein